MSHNPKISLLGDDGSSEPIFLYAKLGLFFLYARLHIYQF